MSSDDGLILDGPCDPDAQAAVTDYIDYTEFLPADLMRSLTLIRGLDERYMDSAQSVHELTKTFGQLPDFSADVRPSAQAVRRDVSHQLDRALDARESAYAEACRLYDVVDSHYNRLDCIKQKLHALPKPSMDPAPAQPPKHAPSARKRDAAPSTTRITLRLDGQDKGRNAAQKSRAQRSLGSGHLGPLHPDSPIASTEQSDEEEEAKPASSEPIAHGASSAGPARRRDKQGKRQRPAAVAASTPATAMSTSNALAMLKPPTDGATPGSPDMPWLRLTEWEMTNLRRKMKKNSVWQPSEVMVHRELALRGRGWEAYRAAKDEAERNGGQFADCDDIMNTYIPGQLTKRGEGKDAMPPTETKLSNRGMKLNEAKRLKRENLAREQAAAAEAEQSKHPGEPANPAQTAAISASPPKGNLKPTRSSRKRNLEEDTPLEIPEADIEASSGLRSATKRQKTGKEVEPASMAETGPSDVKMSPRPPSPAAPRRTSTRAASTAAALQRPPSAPKNVNTPTPPATRPSSRRLSAAFLPEPPAAVSRELRRQSATPVRRTPIPEAAPGRRRKRPAPGPVSSGQDGGAAVSYGRRKAKPVKKKASVPRDYEQESSLPPNHGFRIDEDGVREEIDGSEPRYCVCGDVSFGTMICCENPDVCSISFCLVSCLGFVLTLRSVIGSGSILRASGSPRSPAALLNGTVPIAGLSFIRALMELFGLVLVDRRWSSMGLGQVFGLLHSYELRNG